MGSVQTLKFLRELLNAPIWSHQHWDKTGQHGLNCPICTNQSYWRVKIKDFMEELEE